jgi:hypothetical protein
MNRRSGAETCIIKKRKVVSIKALVQCTLTETYVKYLYFEREQTNRYTTHSPEKRTETEGGMFKLRNLDQKL